MFIQFDNTRNGSFELLRHINTMMGSDISKQVSRSDGTGKSKTICHFSVYIVASSVLATTKT